MAPCCCCPYRRHSGAHALGITECTDRQSGPITEKDTCIHIYPFPFVSSSDALLFTDLSMSRWQETKK